MGAMSFDERMHAAKLYGNFMDEAKKRLRIVEAALTPKVERLLPAPAVSDLCTLQLRKVCEAVALGCLVAHGDMPETRSKNLANHYRADKLINALEKLHSDFFPKPCTIRTLPDGTVTVGRPPDGAYMQKDMLKRLYFLTDREMHVGKLADRTTTFHPVTNDSLAYSVELFWSLLHEHYIQFIDPRLRFVVSLRPDGEVPRIVVTHDGR